MKKATRKATGGEIDIGIPRTARLAIAEGLSDLLADSYTLYLKVHNYHWNVTGPRFRELHAAFEEQYTELALAVDAIAERIRSLGAVAPGSYRDFAARTSIRDADGVPPAETMIEDLLAGHEAVVRTARRVLPLAQEAGDEGTVNLVTDRMGVHEKTAWMLRSMV
jgi:starvation-inducible DNA-binding protein